MVGEDHTSVALPPVNSPVKYRPHQFSNPELSST